MLSSELDLKMHVTKCGCLLHIEIWDPKTAYFGCFYSDIHVYVQISWNETSHTQTEKKLGNCEGSWVLTFFQNLMNFGHKRLTLYNYTHGAWRAGAVIRL